MYCLKPMDEKAVLDGAEKTDLIVTAEEHSPYGGLGSMVAQIVASLVFLFIKFLLDLYINMIYHYVT